MKALVTGATGFVGSAIVRKLLDQGYSVRALARPGSDRRNLDGLEVEVVEGDLTDPLSLRRAVASCRALFHAAADYRLWSPNPEAMYDANVTGTENVLRAAGEAGVERIVYTSSVATLGLPGDGQPGDETTPVSESDMVGHYKLSKFMAEENVRSLADQGLPVVIVNPSTPVGPRDIKPTPTGRLVLDAAAGRMPAYVDTGLNMVHVDDVATGHLLALQKGSIGERYVLGGQDMTLKAILTEIAAITGRRPPRLRMPHNLVLPIAYAAEAWARMTGGGAPPLTVVGIKLARKRMFFSSRKAERELGYSARPVREGLVEAVEWFRANGYLLIPRRPRSALGNGSAGGP